MVPGMDPNARCNIEQGTAKAELLKEAKLIIMDEVTMMSKVDLERIDKTLQFIMENKRPFGGKIILLSGDFRQILPVERNPTDAVNTCLKNSYLWYLSFCWKKFIHKCFLFKVQNSETTLDNQRTRQTIWR